MALLDTRFYSATIQLSLGCTIILPEHAEAWKEPPAVLYLLHGLSGDHTSWVRNSSIERFAREYNLAVVMPEANKSFYSDMMHGADYRAFMTEELPAKINQWFKLSNDRDKTFVAGSSMGGYGAFSLALDRPDLYCAAASLSGALDLPAHIDDEWDEQHSRTFEAVFGETRKVRGTRFDLIHAVNALKTVPQTEFYSCVGTEDWLYQDSVSFRDAAAEKGLYLTYEESGGRHNWDFWNDYIQRVLNWLPIEKLEVKRET